MEKNNKRFKLLDALYISMMILPIICGIVLKILTTPVSEGISISGAKIFFTISLPIQDLPITESQVHSWLVIIAITGLCLFLTHGIKEKADTKRQHIAEWIVENTQKLVNGNMGGYFSGFAPFIAAILGLSAFSSLLALFGLYAPTSDVNVTAGWAILVFFLITYYKMKCGPLIYAKSFADPPLLAPLNIISEFATPLSMAFRHYGNVLSGTIVSALLAFALQNLSSLIFGSLPGFLGEFPFMQIGIPALLSVYFDVFSGCLQAYIFAMLTMLYVADAFPQQEYFERLERKKKEKMKESKA